MQHGKTHMLQILHGLLDVLLFGVAVVASAAPRTGPRYAPLRHLLQGGQELPGRD